MSFSSKTKDELAKILPQARHCRIAEIAAIADLLGNANISPGKKSILTVQTEHKGTARKYFTLLQKTYNIRTDILIRKNTLQNRAHSYLVTVEDEADVRKILESTKLSLDPQSTDEKLFLRENVLLARNCCKRAFIRGAFLAVGSVSDPERSYHFELVCPSERKAIQLKDIICSLNLDAKVVERKKNFIVYLKESNQIAEILGLMDAVTTYMEFENIRIIKDVRNNVNRKVNCETANIVKTVSAGVKQSADIKYISNSVGLESLPKNLMEMAKIRLEYPNATLKELGAILTPAVGKSGVNHRLRKISEYADKLREG